ncbi:MAG: hypothetical protein KAG94_00985 [Clostridiales bacterium]|nr:hypothetical protein [Clostridiales bacterium]
MKKNILIIIVVVMLFTFLSGCVFLPKEDERLSPPIIESKSTEYKTEAVEYGTVSKDVSTFGSFRPINEIAYSFEHLGGSFLQFFVSKNDEIVAGQVIAELDTGNLDKDMRDEEIELKRAQLTFDRNSELFNNNQISEYDYKIAKLNYQKVVNSYNDLLLIKEQSQIFADDNGTISYLAPLEEGDQVTKGNLVFKVVLNNEMKLTCIGSGIYKFDADIPVVIESLNYKTTGVITISNHNSMVVLPNEFSEDWRIGTFVMVTQNVDTVENVLMVNQKAVKTFGGITFAKVLEDGVPIEKEVVLGQTNGRYYEVISGLVEGELAIIY